MTLALGLFVVLVGAVAQTAILPAFSIFGVQPSLLLVILVAWMAARGRRESLVLIPVAGFVQGLLDSQPLGLAMLAMAPLTVMTDVRERRFVESDLLTAVVLTVLATLVYEGIILLTLAVRGEQLEWLASVLDVLVPTAIANVLLLLPVYGAIRLASVDLRRRSAF
ncbi:MAG: rod shape-determining protein MreD [Dehalococcoidia bacterium]